MGLTELIEEERYHPPQRVDLACPDQDCGWNEKGILVVNMPVECPACGEELRIEEAF